MRCFVSAIPTAASTRRISRIPFLTGAGLEPLLLEGGGELELELELLAGAGELVLSNFCELVDADVDAGSIHVLIVFGSTCTVAPFGVFGVAWMASGREGASGMIPMSIPRSSARFSARIVNDRASRASCATCSVTVSRSSGFGRRRRIVAEVGSMSAFVFAMSIT